MDSRRLVKLPNELDERCRYFGIAMAMHYARGGSPNSRAVSSHGMHENPQGLGDGKRAECIFCLEMSLDPYVVINWSAHADGGHDIDRIATWGLRIDVKQTSLNNRYLIWPINKWRFYDSKDFEILVLTKTQGCEGRSVGWLSKEAFKQKMSLADGSVLTLGTPFVHQDKLWPMDDFYRSNPCARLAVRARRQFDFISNQWPRP